MLCVAVTHSLTDMMDSCVLTNTVSIVGLGFFSALRRDRRSADRVHFHLLSCRPSLKLRDADGSSAIIRQLLHGGGISLAHLLLASLKAKRTCCQNTAASATPSVI